MSIDDSPEREFNIYDSEGLPGATLEREESTSNLSESEAISNRSTPMDNPKPRRKPRREVWWLDLGTTNHSLMSIGRCFKDRLNWSLLSSSNSLLPRRIKSPKDDNLRRNLHQCPGYLREEITLTVTCDLSKSVIVSHAFPGPSERCSTCHQLVQHPYADYNNIHYLPTLNNSLSLPPTEGALTFDHFVPVGDIGSFTSNIGVKSSDASFETSELFKPSLPFSEDLQSIQSTTSSSSQTSSISPISPSMKRRSRRAILGTTMTSPSTRRRSLVDTMALIQGVLDGRPGRIEEHEDMNGPPSRINTETSSLLQPSSISPISPSTSKKGHSRQSSLGTTMTSPSTRRRSLKNTMALIQSIFDERPARIEDHDDSNMNGLTDKLAGLSVGKNASPGPSRH
jgi:hypothetical protein